MSFAVSYGVVEVAFSVGHSVTAEVLPAFRARLRLLKRLGFPPGVNTGKGRHAQYGAGEILLLAIALEVIQLGQTSEDAARLVRQASDEIRAATMKALELGLMCGSIYLAFDPADLFGRETEIRSFGLSDVKRELAKQSTRRLAIVNLTAAIRAVVSGLFLIAEGTETAFRRGLNEWVRVSKQGD